MRQREREGEREKVGEIDQLQPKPEEVDILEKKTKVHLRN